MKTRGFSQLFWMAIIAVIAVPLSVDRFLGFMAAQKHAPVASAEPASQLSWQRQDFKELGLSIELPSVPEPDQGFVKADGEDSPRIGAYVGAVPQIRYQFGRHTIDKDNPFDAKAYLKEEFDAFKKAPGLSDVKGSIDKIEWEGARAYESNITFSRFGRPTRLHFRVRATGRDWLFLGGEYPLKTEGAGEHAWKVMLDSLKLDAKPKGDSEASLATVTGSEPVGFDKWRFRSLEAGIALTVPCKLEESEKTKIGQPGADGQSYFIYQGNWCDTSLELSAEATKGPVDLERVAKYDLSRAKRAHLVSRIEPISFDGHPACAMMASYTESGKRCESVALYFQAGDLLYVLRESYFSVSRAYARKRWMEIVESVKLDSATQAPILR